MLKWVYGIIIGGRGSVAGRLVKGLRTNGPMEVTPFYMMVASNGLFATIIIMLRPPNGKRYSSLLLFMTYMYIEYITVITTQHHLLHISGLSMTCTLWICYLVWFKHPWRAKFHAKFPVPLVPIHLRHPDGYWMMYNHFTTTTFFSSGLLSYHFS